MEDNDLENSKIRWVNELNALVRDYAQEYDLDFDSVRDTLFPDLVIPGFVTVPLTYFEDVLVPRIMSVVTPEVFLEFMIDYTLNEKDTKMSEIVVRDDDADLPKQLDSWIRHLETAVIEYCEEYVLDFNEVWETLGYPDRSDWPSVLDYFSEAHVIWFGSYGAIYDVEEFLADSIANALDEMHPEQGSQEQENQTLLF